MQRIQEISFHGRKALTGNRRAGHQNEHRWCFQLMLVEPERFPQESARPVASHGVADSPGSDDAKSVVASCWERFPVGNQTAACQALPGILERGEIPRTTETQRAVQPVPLMTCG